jgi:sugar lactone lactonase YvrE
MVEVAVNYSCFLGEGPVWDRNTNSILWVDILLGDIHEFNPLTTSHTVFNVHQMVGAVAICSDGNLLAALQSGLSIINRQTGKISTFSHPESNLPGNRFNDGKCDPKGRFWIGTMAIDELPNAGGVYMLDSDHNISKKIEGTSISNGMAWSADHKTYYYIDTPTMAIVAYDFDKSNGHISNKRMAFTIDERDGYPDGITIDNEGMLWVAHWNGWQVSRWNPFTGKKIFTLSLPVANVTSCTFGGDDLQDLYITTARKGLSADDLKAQPLAGNLFVWRNSEYQGTPASEYKVNL